MSDQAVKSGYLHQDFRIFYNADSLKKTFPLHYHDFHKLMLVLGGHAGYIIEGRQYDLQPLVPARLSMMNPCTKGSSSICRMNTSGK